MPDGSDWLFCILGLFRIFVDTMNWFLIKNIAIIQEVEWVLCQGSKFFLPARIGLQCAMWCHSLVLKSSYKNKKLTVNFYERFRPIMKIYFPKIIIRKKILIGVALVNIITAWMEIKEIQDKVYFYEPYSKAKLTSLAFWMWATNIGFQVEK